MSKLRSNLVFLDERAAIADIERLRGGYARAGQWTLPQIGFHLAFPIEQSLHPPRSPEPTATQKQMQHFVETVAAHGWPVKPLDAPEPMRPPASASNADVDRLVAALNRLADYNADKVEMIIFGPIETDQFRKFALAHAAHHLAFLQPKSTGVRRANLSYANEDAAIADVNRLRKGYTQGGAWSLQQTCWHLNITTKARMARGPFPPDTTAQIERKSALAKILATGQLPDGIVAPSEVQPPDNCNDSDIDALIASLNTLRDYRGELAPHRIFGHMPDADIRKLNLIHCARHLSFLTPTN